MNVYICPNWGRTTYTAFACAFLTWTMACGWQTATAAENDNQPPVNIMSHTEETIPVQTSPNTPATAAPAASKFSIIDAPDKPTGVISLADREFSGGNMQGFFTYTAATLQGNLHRMVDNMNALAALSSEQNQQALDRFGSTYANIPGLGTNFSTGISSVNIAGINQSIGGIGENLGKMAASFNESETTITKTVGPSQDTLKAAIDSTEPGNAASEMVKNGQISDKFVQSQNAIFGTMFKLVYLNNAIASLNSNLESTKSSYANVLSLGTQPPSTIMTMHVGPAVGQLDGVAINQFGGLSQMDAKLGDVNRMLELLQKNGGMQKLVDPEKPTGETFNSFQATLGGLLETVNTSNDMLAQSLGKSGKAPPLVPLDSDTLKGLIPENTQLPKLGLEGLKKQTESPPSASSLSPKPAQAVPGNKPESAPPATAPTGDPKDGK